MTDTHAYRAIFISDVHLGTYGCQGEKLATSLIAANPSIYIWSATSSTVGD